ncbi:MAG: VWA domain-containing protein [Myxococcales bacterium]|nr:VWA domain-containing protein [Myxococcales bacterium]
MNRTGIFLAAAGLLALIALVIGLPRVAPSVQVQPPPEPLVAVTPAPAVASDGSIKMQARLSHPFVSTGRSDVFATVELFGVEVPGAERTPVNFAVVIDRSGSMSGFKLSQAKLAAKQLVSLLRPADRLAIVHYGSDVKSMPAMPATAENKERMLSTIDAIWDDGGTNIGAGLSVGRDHLLASRSDFKVNRMILISDGQPTEGMTDHAGLTGLAQQIRQHGVTVSAIGVGTDFNEDLMQAIAEMGAGAYGYLEDASRLATIFQKDLQQAGTTVARQVELSFELPDGVELGEILGYRAVQNGRLVTVSMADFSSGQMERVVARLVVDAPAAGKSFDVTGLKLRYTDLLKNGQVESNAKLLAMATDRQELILANRDKDATVHAARAQGAWNLQQAADHLKRGDRAKANEYLRRNVDVYNQAAVVAGPAALADDFKAQGDMEAAFESAQDEGQVQRSVKAAKVQSRKSFGLMGSTY